MLYVDGGGIVAARHNLRKLSGQLGPGFLGYDVLLAL